MATELTWLGHGGWSMKIGPHRVLLDPFLDDSPVAPKKAAEVNPHTILLSHGHFDHVSDAVTIATRTGANVLGSFEICEWLKSQGVAEEKLLPMNLGGGVAQPFGRVTMTIAHHSSSLPDGRYGGPAAGFVVETPARKRIYFACDTAMFLDMKLIAAQGIDVAVVPIGDQFTMGPSEAVEAVKLIHPKHVLPCHYNTWPPIAQDAQGWAQQIRTHTAAEPVVLQPGESFSV